MGVVGAHGPAAEPEHGGFEGESGPGAGLVEESGHHTALEPAGRAVRLALHLGGPGHELVEELAGELLALDHVLQVLHDGHEKISFPASPDRT